MPGERGTTAAVASLVIARIVYATNWLNIGAIFALMQPTLGVGVVGLGTLTSSFYLGLGLVQVPAGLLAARVGAKRVVVAGIMLSSFCTVAIAASNQLAEVAVLRFMVGAGMAFTFAPGVVLLTQLFGGKAGAGVGVFNSAYDVGGLIGLYVWVVIATSVGWQPSLLLSGGLGVATGVLVQRFVPGAKEEPAPASGKTLLQIVGDLQLILLGLGTLGLSVGNTLVSSFAVYYLHKSLGVSLDYAGLAASMIVVVPIVIALWGGRLYDRTGRPRFLLVLSLLGTTLALLLMAVPSFASAVAGAVVGGVASGVGFTVAFAWARDLNRADPKYDGLAIAWVNGISLTGAFFPPLVFSWVASAAGYGAAWLTGGAICLALTVPALLQREGIPARAA